MGEEISKGLRTIETVVVYLFGDFLLRSNWNLVQSFTVILCRNKYVQYEKSKEQKMVVSNYSKSSANFIQNPGMESLVFILSCPRSQNRGMKIFRNEGTSMWAILPPSDL